MCLQSSDTDAEQFAVEMSPEHRAAAAAQRESPRGEEMMLQHAVSSPRRSTPSPERSTRPRVLQSRSIVSRERLAPRLHLFLCHRRSAPSAQIVTAAFPALAESHRCFGWNRCDFSLFFTVFPSLLSLFPSILSLFPSLFPSFCHLFPSFSLRRCDA